ncbi:MAG TPA: carbamate kinase family protein [Syntrophomonadaceae bacterium]|nr:carbamate kinase family protein [Syntrophomonadaceae bacterium]
MGKSVVIAIGGNSLIKDKDHESIQDQYEAVCEIAANIADLVQENFNIVITHGNGPQVGFALRRSEVAHEIAKTDLIPLVNCVADTQGGIGYQIQQALNNEFILRGIDKEIATIITQVEVSKDDLNLQNPTKPIGSFLTPEQAQEMKDQHPDWVIIEDSGRGYRRLVPSPKPIDIIEKGVIKSLIDSAYLVIAVGGGGIPVIKKDNQTYHGIDAVIDKDFSTSLLAEQVDADILIMTTSVPKVCINLGKPDQKELGETTVEEIKKYVKAGHFLPGSMLPKIEASLKFLEKPGRTVIITNPENLKEAIKKNAGTHITRAH